MSECAILCVDDDPTVLIALRGVLAKLGAGFLIEIAESGEEALEIEADLRSQGRDLAVVISDFIMPVMRGDELLVRLHEVNPDAIKIMLTGQSEFDGIKNAINHANLYRFLEKPFNNDDILLTTKSATIAFDHKRELKLQNEQLWRLNGELEKTLERIKIQGDELTRSEARATVSALVTSVAHELGAPLGNSVLIADTLSERTAEISRSLEQGQIKRRDLDDYAKVMLDSSTLLKRNLRRACDLLANFKQVASDQVSEQRREFNLCNTVGEILATLAPSLRNKPHRVVVEIPAEIVVDGLPGALGQVVINLVNNAYTHAFDGRDDGVLIISATEINDRIHMCFSDNGIGISEVNLVRMMEPFFSTKIGHGGTGLGMSIVESLVSKSLGGTLSTSSTLGVGTRFLIEFPSRLSTTSS